MTSQKATLKNISSLLASERASEGKKVGAHYCNVYDVYVTIAENKIL